MENDQHYTDRHFMRRALALAALGGGHVSPNPLVGCVIVHDHRIIGEGWHRKYGEAHAEVNAVSDVADKQLLAESTVYVSLEPCAHTGKTPPCADMLVGHRVRKVVVANQDPNPLVAGEGLRKLRTAGIEVVTDVLHDEGRLLNRRFFTYMEQHRPYIILKWAQTADGFIARENYDSKWISNTYARQLVHKWRAEEDAVMVGTGTARYDNPRLNVRDWTGRNPVRVVADRFLKLDRALHLFDCSQPTLCYNTLQADEQPNLLRVQISDAHFLDDLVQDLYRRRIQSVIVEGGSELLSLFIRHNLWDEARIFTAPRSFGRGIKAPALGGNLMAQESVVNDTLHIYTRKDEKS